MEFSLEERTPFSRHPASLRLASVNLEGETDLESFDWLIRCELHDMPNDFDGGLSALCKNPTLGKCPALLRRIAKHTRCAPAQKALAARSDLPLFPDVVATLRERHAAKDALFESHALKPFILAAQGSLSFEETPARTWAALAANSESSSPNEPSPVAMMRAYFELGIDD